MRRVDNIQRLRQDVPFHVRGAGGSAPAPAPTFFETMDTHTWELAWRFNEADFPILNYGDDGALGDLTEFVTPAAGSPTFEAAALIDDEPTVNWINPDNPGVTTFDAGQTWSTPATIESNGLTVVWFGLARSGGEGTGGRIFHAYNAGTEIGMLTFKSDGDVEGKIVLATTTATIHTTSTPLAADYVADTPIMIVMNYDHATKLISLYRGQGGVVSDITEGAGAGAGNLHANWGLSPQIYIGNAAGAGARSADAQFAWTSWGNTFQSDATQRLAWLEASGF